MEEGLYTVNSVQRIWIESLQCFKYCESSESNTVK